MSKKEEFKAMYGDKNHLTDIFKNCKDNDVSELSLNNHLIDSSHLDMAISHRNCYTREAAAKHKLVSDHQLSQLVNDNNEYVREAVMRNNNLGEKTLDNAIKNPDNNVRYQASIHAKVTPAHIDHILKNEPDWIIRHAALLSDNANRENMKTALQDSESEIVDYANRKLKK